MAYIDASARIEATTINEFFRAKVEPIYRSSVLMGAIKSHGRETYDHGGKMMEWHPKFRRRTITPGQANPTASSFPQTNVRKKVTLPWRKYEMGESINKF